MHVRVLGLWSGPEFDSFVTVKSAWEQNTGGTVDWTRDPDLPAELDAQIAAGTPPDIAILPNIGLMHELAEEGQLVALPSVMDMDQLQRTTPPHGSTWAATTVSCTGSSTRSRTKPRSGTTRRRSRPPTTAFPRPGTR